MNPIPTPEEIKRVLGHLSNMEKEDAIQVAEKLYDPTGFTLRYRGIKPDGTWSKQALLGVLQGLHDRYEALKCNTK